MSRPSKIYTRLTRDAAGLGSYYSLWLASEHLMLVTSTGYSESYARLQLRDVKAFFLTPTDRRLWFGVGWGAVAVPGLIALAMRLANSGTPIFSIFFSVLGVTGLVWNHLLGPGCRAYAVTGVQTAHLRSLVRMKQANRVVARLQPLIEAAQADLAVPPVIDPAVAAPPDAPANPPPPAAPPTAM